jgi:hypothetical protein
MDDRVNLTDLIHRAEKGDTTAADRLFAATYDDLQRLARRRLAAGGRNTLLDTTSLVHESYLRFAASGTLHLEDRVHLLRWAGHVRRPDRTRDRAGAGRHRSHRASRLGEGPAVAATGPAVRHRKPSA